MAPAQDTPPPPSPRIVLCAGGHDPSGGAGLLADAEAIRANGAHATTVATCWTVQDTCGVTSMSVNKAHHVTAQWRAARGDSAAAAIKIGLIGSAALATAIARLIDEGPSVPIVLDPVLASGSGALLADEALVGRLGDDLLRRSTLATPNLPEAQQLSGRKDGEACARRLLDTGCPWILITGTHAPGTEVINRLYGRNGACHEWRWARLPYHYHGSGCTLASAIAARLALGEEMIDAVGRAQRYTWETLARARRTGRCQLTPNRLFLLDERERSES